ncbi:serine-threonine protein kinase [Streptomyces chiangmaiensis]|uniref:Serine-threonine protein kinase n=1 Tax=Streptomyces chiangmaiensis TaxID=766497 RepID=A0ABU7FBV7_9ACTN|nr:serine-threonine protein kinase [Streptomyces chiangmaiensis]MED7821365.1 serine-threonine protein kinase [Streptomyces chiangmaiensis]
MAAPAIGVSPYWELTFDADGDVDGPERDRLLTDVSRRGVRDLLVFAHGWNNERSGATRLYGRFFAPVTSLAPKARLGYVGVIWPSMMFADEPIPDFPPSAAAVPVPPRPQLDKNSRRALLEVFPGRASVVEQIVRLLEQHPDDGPSLEEFGRLVRLLVEVRPEGPQASCAADLLTEGASAVEPGMLTWDTAQVCRDFAGALERVESGDGEASGTEAFSFTPKGLWDGAHELLRQATYYAMKRRAGAVGEHGLGPVLGRLAQAAPDVRVHLVGHSFGGRLVSFALRGLPEGVDSVKSVTLLQGAFSHYAFAPRLPDAPHAEGALSGCQHRIDGPLVCCYSRFDSALGTLYPLASRMAGDDRSMAGEAPGIAEEFGIGRVLGPKWGAMGHDGVQAVDGTQRLALADALKRKLPASGCVNIDASAVVRHGGPPSGAHSDIVHRELAQVVLAAGRVS